MDRAGPVIAPPIARNVASSARECCQLGPDESVPSLPPGFLPFLDHPLAWAGACFENDTDYIFCLRNTDLAELQVGLDAFKCMVHKLFHDS
jgi:hypothetical protein